MSCVFIGSGSVYYYTLIGSDWSLQSKLLNNDGYSKDAFGSSISIFDNNALIGAMKDSDKALLAGENRYLVRVIY
jgi:hypothetical protein